MTKPELELAEKILSKTETLNKEERSFVHRFLKHGDLVLISEAADCTKQTILLYLKDESNNSRVEPYVKTVFKNRFEAIQEKLIRLEQKLSA